MRVRLVGVAFLKIIERSGNGGNANEENNKIHDDLLLKKRHAKQKNAASLMVWIRFPFNNSGKKQSTQELFKLRSVAE